MRSSQAWASVGRICSYCSDFLMLTPFPEALISTIPSQLTLVITVIDRGVLEQEILASRLQSPHGSSSIMATPPLMGVGKLITITSQVGIGALHRIAMRLVLPALILIDR